MTRTYALCKLLEHGPMTRRQIIDCTRWPTRQADEALAKCIAHNLIRTFGKARVGNDKVQTLYRGVNL